MSDLAQFLLNLVHDPDSARAFRADSQTEIDGSSLSEADKTTLTNLVANTPPILQEGGFYTNFQVPENGKIIARVSSATQHITSNMLEDHCDDHSVAVLHDDHELLNSNRIVLQPTGNTIVHVDHALDETHPRRTGKLTAMTIEFDDD